MRIGDGTGKNYEAKVDNENFLHTLAYNLPYSHHVNYIEKSAYSAVFNVTPINANSTFFYLKNTDEDDLIITTIKLFADSTEDVEVCLCGVGTPIGGTDLTPVNKTSGTANTADCVCLSGNNITGLSGTNIVDRFVLSNLNKTERYIWNSSLIISKNTILTLCGVNIKGTLSFYFHGIH